VLGAGYGLGAATLVSYAQGYGVEMGEKVARQAIASYREANALVVNLWYGLEQAMRECLSTGRARKFGHVSFRRTQRAVLMRLPAGTEITYWDAQLDADGRISYEGVDQYSGHWKRITTWGGKLAENATQSVSRDVLVHGLQGAVRAGLDVVLHVHDEIVCQRRSPADLDALLGCMVAPPWCAEAPIKAAGFECPRYRKD
jgi:DNA polymerase